MLPCEVAVKALLPVLKAMVAKELVEVHGFKQTEAAKMLGTTQPSISQYLRGIRGRALDVKNVKGVEGVIEVIAHMLVAGDASRERVFVEFCKACSAARMEGLMCDMHKRLEPTLDIEECELCGSPTACGLDLRSFHSTRERGKK